ncbi:MAG: LptF/LptG family permease [Candidatus Omnitrophica bacterium]|nr:LptF/LptG family permease [Candidatus Omnitrophota bacterium]
MKTLRSYILFECILPFFLALGVLTCVFLLGNLVQLTHMVINKGVSLAVVGKIFLLYIPTLLGYTMPFACLASIIMAFSRLSNDNEIIAIRASGIYLKRLLVPLFVIGIIFSLISFILNDRVIPYTHHEQKKMFKILGGSNPTALLEPGVFINSFDGKVIFIHKINGTKMQNVTIWLPQPDGKPTRTIISKKGEFIQIPEKKQILLKLIDGTSDEADLKNPNNFYKLNFKNLFITLDTSKHAQKVKKKPKGMSLKELKNEMNRLGMLMVDSSRIETEYYRKIAWSFSPLIFILLGFPLAVITNRRAKTANWIITILFASAYYLLSLGCEALSIEQIAAPNIIMWGPDVLGGFTALILNYRLNRI